MKPIVCLNMIVKDEAHVIRRCLRSVRPFIDRWCIVDTGSSDGTQDIVRAYLRDIPGELHERPWRDFGHNRTEALRLAEPGSEYLLFIDADETLCAPHGFAWPHLTADAYSFTVEYSGSVYGRCALVATRLRWQWVGVVHEYLQSTPPTCQQPLEWPRLRVAHDGARSRDPATYARDAELLERALAEDPGNARYAFYLAQSYRDAGMPARARDAYLARVAMGGWEEEAWYALYQAACMGERIAREPADVAHAYLAAHQRRPRRAEPLCRLAGFYRERGEFALAYLFARHGVMVPRPSDTLFVEEDVYRWRLLDELGTAAYYVGAFSEGRGAIERALREGYLPETERGRLERNLRFYSSSRAASAP